MKMKSVLLLAVAMGCGLVAMIGVQKVLSGNKSNGADKKVKVLVATTEIAPGTALSEENVGFKDWPASAIPEGAVTKQEEFANRALRIRAVPGEVIMKAKLGNEGEIGASNDIPKGMRVVTVPVDQTMAQSGLMLPGDHVDVLATFRVRSPEGGYSEHIETALEDVEIFAVDNIRDITKTEAAEMKAKNISLVILPEEATLLKFVENRGSLHLTLRPKGDRIVDKKVRTIEELFKAQDTSRIVTEDNENSSAEEPVQSFLANVDEPQAETAPESPKWLIEIFSGDQKEVVEVDLPEDKAKKTKSKPAKEPVLN